MSLDLVMIMNGIGTIGRLLPNYFADSVGTLTMFKVEMSDVRCREVRLCSQGWRGNDTLSGREWERRDKESEKRKVKEWLLVVVVLRKGGGWEKGKRRGWAIME